MKSFWEKRITIMLSIFWLLGLFVFIGLSYTIYISWRNNEENWYQYIAPLAILISAFTASLSVQKSIQSSENIAKEKSLLEISTVYHKNEILTIRLLSTLGYLANSLENIKNIMKSIPKNTKLSSESYSFMHKKILEEHTNALVEFNSTFDYAELSLFYEADRKILGGILLLSYNLEKKLKKLKTIFGLVDEIAKVNNIIEESEKLISQLKDITTKRIEVLKIIIRKSKSRHQFIFDEKTYSDLFKEY